MEDNFLVEEWERLEDEGWSSKRFGWRHEWVVHNRGVGCTPMAKWVGKVRKGLDAGNGKRNHQKAGDVWCTSEGDKAVNEKSLVAEVH